ncbi:MAG: hypothetical protein ACK4NC_06205 [Candidatus Gracilibacteria bacterium]
MIIEKQIRREQIIIKEEIIMVKNVDQTIKEKVNSLDGILELLFRTRYYSRTEEDEIQKFIKDEVKKVSEQDAYITASYYIQRLKVTTQALKGFQISFQRTDAYFDKIGINFQNILFIPKDLLCTMVKKGFSFEFESLNSYFTNDAIEFLEHVDEIPRLVIASSQYEIPLIKTCANKAKVLVRN